MFRKTLVSLLCASVFLSDVGCVMTQAQGDKLTHQLGAVEDEIAKLQRLRHDMEILLTGQMRDLVDRIARLESQLQTLRHSLTEGSSKNIELFTEIQNLREELDQSQHRYRNLVEDQQNLAKNQAALKEAQKRIRIPPLKEKHFALAKEHYVAGKLEEAVMLFENFVEEYPKEKEAGEAHYLLGEIFYKRAEADASTGESEKLYKKSAVFYQKSIDLNKDPTMREEALYKIGLVLKAINNKDGAKAAFKEVLASHAKGKRAKDAKKQLAELGTGTK